MPATQEHIRRRCNRCGYDLGASLESPTCPECGTPIEVAAAKRRFPRAPFILSLIAGLLTLGWLGVGVFLLRWALASRGESLTSFMSFFLWSLTLPLIALAGIVVSVALILLRRRIGRGPIIIWFMIAVLATVSSAYIYQSSRGVLRGLYREIIVKPFGG